MNYEERLKRIIDNPDPFWYMMVNKFIVENYEDKEEGINSFEVLAKDKEKFNEIIKKIMSNKEDMKSIKNEIVDYINNKRDKKENGNTVRKDYMDEIKKDIGDKNYELARKKLLNLLEIATYKQVEDEEKTHYSFYNYIESLIYFNYFKPQKRNVISNVMQSQIYYYLGYIEIEENNYGKALEYLTEGEKWNPVDVVLLFEKVATYRYTNQIEKFREELLKIHKYIFESPYIAKFFRELGWYYIEKGNLDVANALFTESMQYLRTDNAINELKYIAQKENREFRYSTREEIKRLFEEYKIPLGFNKQTFEMIHSEYQRLNESKEDMSILIFLSKVLYDITLDPKFMTYSIIVDRDLDVCIKIPDTWRFLKKADYEKYNIPTTIRFFLLTQSNQEVMVIYLNDCTDEQFENAYKYQIKKMKEHKEVIVKEYTVKGQKHIKQAFVDTIKDGKVTRHFHNYLVVNNCLFHIFWQVPENAQDIEKLYENVSNSFAMGVVNSLKRINEVEKPEVIKVQEKAEIKTESIECFGCKNTFEVKIDIPDTQKTFYCKCPNCGMELKRGNPYYKEEKKVNENRENNKPKIDNTEFEDIIRKFNKYEKEEEELINEINKIKDKINIVRVYKIEGGGVKDGVILEGTKMVELLWKAGFDGELDRICYTSFENSSKNKPNFETIAAPDSFINIVRDCVKANQRLQINLKTDTAIRIGPAILKRFIEEEIPQNKIENKEPKKEEKKEKRKLGPDFLELIELLWDIEEFNMWNPKEHGSLAYVLDKLYETEKYEEKYLKMVSLAKEKKGQELAIMISSEIVEMAKNDENVSLADRTHLEKMLDYEKKDYEDKELGGFGIIHEKYIPEWFFELFSGYIKLEELKRESTIIKYCKEEHKMTQEEAQNTFNKLYSQYDILNEFYFYAKNKRFKEFYPITAELISAKQLCNTICKTPLDAYLYMVYLREEPEKALKEFNEKKENKKEEKKDNLKEYSQVIEGYPTFKFYFPESLGEYSKKDNYIFEIKQGNTQKIRVMISKCKSENDLETDAKKWIEKNKASTKMEEVAYRKEKIANIPLEVYELKYTDVEGKVNKIYKAGYVNGCRITISGGLVKGKEEIINNAFKTLKWDEEKKENKKEEIKDNLKEYLQEIDGYPTFKFYFPSYLGKYEKKSDTVFEITDKGIQKIRVMISKCSSKEALKEKAKNWIEKNIKANQMEIIEYREEEINEIPLEVYILKYIKEKNKVNKIYKCGYVNNCMVTISGGLTETLIPDYDDHNPCVEQSPLPKNIQKEEIINNAFKTLKWDEPKVIKVSEKKTPIIIECPACNNSFELKWNVPSSEKTFYCKCPSCGMELKRENPNYKGGNKQKGNSKEKIMKYLIDVLKQTEKNAVSMFEYLNQYEDIMNEFASCIDGEKFIYCDNGIEVEGYSAKSIKESVGNKLSDLGVYNYLVYLREKPEEAKQNLLNGLPRK